MIFADEIHTGILDIELQYGAFALCGLLILVVYGIVRGLLKLLNREKKANAELTEQNDKLSDRNKEQNEIIDNHMTDVYEQLGKLTNAVSRLPCQVAGVCTEEGS